MNFHLCPFGAGLFQGGILSLTLCLATAPVASAQESPMTIIADYIRRHGLLCEEPRRAEVDVHVSRPDALVWALTCKNATYHVTLIPHAAARIELVE
jgi:hypothetical protein